MLYTLQKKIMREFHIDHPGVSIMDLCIMYLCINVRTGLGWTSILKKW